jgi:hypothetical protein
MTGRRPRLGGVFVLPAVPDLGGLSNLPEKLVARLILISAAKAAINSKAHITRLEAAHLQNGVAVDFWQVLCDGRRQAKISSRGISLPCVVGEERFS